MKKLKYFIMKYSFNTKESNKRGSKEQNDIMHRENRKANNRDKSSVINNSMKCERIKQYNQRQRLTGQKSKIQLYFVYQRHILDSKIQEA